MSRRTWFRLVLLSGLLVGLGFVPGWTQATTGKKYALLVGVREYDSSALRPLEFTENDVEALARELRKPSAGFEVRVMTSTRGGKDKPTAANIRAALRELLRGKTKRDTVLVALAGHGVQLEVKDPDGKSDPKTYSFFCPMDADLTDVSYRSGHADTMLNLDDLFKLLGDSNPGVKLVLMDACRNELTVKGNTRSLADSRVTMPDGVLALFSCGKRQVSWESKDLRHGVFFHFVLEGLRGKAGNGDGEITWASLTDYTTRQVTRNVGKLIGGGARQTPAVVGYHEGESPLLVAPGKEVVVREKQPETISNSVGMKLVLIPRGKFTMGSPAEEKDRSDDEGPRHEVEITRPFYLGVYEVTQQQYEKVMGKNPSWFSTAGGGADRVKGLDTSEFPVESVSWKEAVEFCEKLSARKQEKDRGRAYRLPTEAEWEYACRAGSSSTFHFGASLSSTQANFDGNHPHGGGERGPFLERTCKVGSYRPNAWGLYDMHGNVGEWCSDWYDRRCYGDKRRRDPQGPARGLDRVFRGGSWGYGSKYCRSAERSWFGPNSRSHSLGFRIAADVGRK